MSDEELAKDLGPLAALTIGVGTMIGAGIFVLPGEAVKNAGPLAAAAFVLGGGIALLTAFSASELGTAMPKSGGAYYYINEALGPLFGSISGVGNWMGLAFASAFYMFGFGEYVNSFVSLPFEKLDLVIVTLSPAKVIALIGVILFIVVNYVGAKETGRLQNFIVITLVAILTVFTIAGVLNADISKLRPFVPPDKGITPLLPTTALIFVSYLGFVQITSVAEEIKNPSRNLPRAVIGSVVIVSAIYALVLLAVLAAVDNQLVAGNDTAVVDVARTLIGPIGAAALLFGGLLATASSANASILASSRINFAMGREKIVTPKLNKIHPRFATPYRSILLTGALIFVFLLFGDLKTLAKAGSVLHLIIYGLLNLSIIVMREADAPNYEPDYTIPLYPVIPILGTLISFGLIAYIGSLEVYALAFVLVVGSILWYALYARTKIEDRGVLSEYILSRSDEMPGPAVSAASAVQPDGGEYRVMVPLSNPETEHDLIELASAIAKEKGGTVDAVHIVDVPDQTSLEYASEHVDEFDPITEQLLERAREDAETFGVPIETHTILSHLSFEEVFESARRHEADLVVMGWGEDSHGSPGRAESVREELSHNIPCDFLVLKDRGLDLENVLVPTAGGPDSDLSAMVAKILRDQFGSEVTLLHVADNETQEEGREFLTSWSEEHGLEGAEMRVEEGDIEEAIENASKDCSLLIMGATEKGLISRMITGSIVIDVVEDVDCSVLLAEKAQKRSLLERLFNR